jgi:hypothetical protein
MPCETATDLLFGLSTWHKAHTSSHDLDFVIPTQWWAQPHPHSLFLWTLAPLAIKKFTTLAKACTSPESPFHTRLHVISKSPLSGLLDSTPPTIDMPVIMYLTMTNIQPRRNPAGAFQPSSTNISIPSPCQVGPKLVPLNQCNCFTRRLLFCNQFVSSWYGVRYNPGKQIQKHRLLDIHIWKLCYLLTTTLGKSHSFLNKSLIHYWKRATGCILLRTLFCDILRTLCPWQSSTTIRREHWHHAQCSILRPLPKGHFSGPAGDCWIQQVACSYSGAGAGKDLYCLAKRCRMMPL